MCSVAWGQLIHGVLDDNYYRCVEDILLVDINKIGVSASWLVKCIPLFSVLHETAINLFQIIYWVILNT